MMSNPILDNTIECKKKFLLAYKVFTYKHI